ncbi:unnamed protein product [Merluccius merluccius]
MSYLHVSSLAFLLSYVLWSMAACGPRGSMAASSSPSGSFLYFAYGSNMLQERLRLRNPSAAFYSVGYLQNYTLQFGYWSKNFSAANGWHGGVATIEERQGDDVWGVVWRMGGEHLPTLDQYEGVQAGAYRPLEVNVTTAEGHTLCRSYQMNDFNPYLTSPPYKQHGLPLDYVEKLEAVETNGYEGPSILDKIEGLKAASSSPN